MPLTTLNRKLYGNGRKLQTLGGNSRIPRAPSPSLAQNDFDKIDPLVQSIHSVMGGRPKDLKLAIKCAKLKQSKLPEATTPELICYIWLTEHGIPFDYQVEAEGGRQHHGGSVIDFLVRPGRVWAWRIQGTYWHNLTKSQEVDELRRKLLEGGTVLGYQLDGVVDCWEQRIYQDRDTVFTMGLVGIEIGE